MTEQQLLALARAEGFQAAMIAPAEVPTDPKFRAFCEENLCGHYGANYSCPPDCGSPEDLRKTLLAEQQAMVVGTTWEIGSYANKDAVRHARVTHNAAVLHLMAQLRKAGYAGFCAGYNGCPLCTPCKRQEHQPCAHPELRISCLSAYCVDAAELARRCHMEFSWEEQTLHLFGLIAFHSVEENGI